MFRYFLLLFLFCPTPLWALVPNPTNNVEYSLSADSAKGREQTLGFALSPSKLANLDVTIGSSIIPLEDGTENTSSSYGLGVDIFPESPLTLGSGVNYWGLKDNLQVLTYDFHLEYKNGNFAIFMAPGMGSVNATTTETVGAQDSTKSEMQYIKTKISLYDLSQWNLKFYYEKYNFQSDIDGLAAEDAVDVFSESTLYLSSHLISEMAALEALYGFNDEWDLGAYYELSQSATDRSKTQLASFLADYYPADPWRISLEVGHYRPFQETADVGSSANFASLSSRYSF